MNLKPILLAVAALAVALVAAPQASRAGDLTVVELYTSQGCSSCPPADRLLAELARQPGVLALGFHVDYWDYIGWKDPFAIAAAGKRQRAYADRFHERYVYTPAMVVQGRAQVAGAREASVAKLIAEARRTAAAATVSLERTGDAVAVHIGEGEAAGGEADVWLALYDLRLTTDIGRGENAGRKLTYSNVVREFRRIGAWDGKARTITLPASEMAGRGGCAVLVQQPDHGPIVGAARLETATR